MLSPLSSTAYFQGENLAGLCIAEVKEVLMPAIAPMAVRHSLASLACGKRWNNLHVVERKVFVSLYVVWYGTENRMHDRARPELHNEPPDVQSSPNRLEQ